MIGAKPDAARKHRIRRVVQLVGLSVGFFLDSPPRQAIKPTGIVFRRRTIEKRTTIGKCSFLAAGRYKINDSYNTSNVCKIYRPITALTLTSKSHYKHHNYRLSPLLYPF